jgi:phosphate-selective porin OprO and OprP
VTRLVGRDVLLVLMLLAAPAASAAQQNAGQPESQGGIDDTIDAAEEEGEPPKGLTWNEWDGRYFSIRGGGGYLLDYAAYSQDEHSKEQFALSSDWKPRDLRVLFKGRLKFLGDTTWSAGIMYDFTNEEWVFRQTGLMFSVPKVAGHFFVGRTKEGFSMNKVMVGYGGWTMERAPINDATLPILADGIKWLGYAPKAHLIWNIGVYGDTFSEGQGFSTYENQVSGRLAWVPIVEDGGALVHVGFSVRVGKPNNDSLNVRARPGAWPAPYFVETGKFATTGTTLTGVEVYYRPGKYTFGSEYFFQNVDAPESGDPFFHGGEVFASWLITGESRSYNTQGGYFNQIAPRDSVFTGGPGAWEVLGHATWIDLDSGTLSGGQFWRLTPMVNWYLSGMVRLEFAYGYGSLDRFGLVGKTHFFQTRLQFQL